MSRLKAMVTPSVLKWARERARFDLDAASERIGRPPDEIRAWEDGSDQPSMAQARKAAEVYKRSLAVFYLPKPPKDFETLRDFRTLPGTTQHGYSPELALLIRRLQGRQQWARDYLIAEAFEPLSFVGSATRRTPEIDIAKSIRSTLDISLDQQASCKDRREALNLWIERAEECGVFVCREGKIASEEACGIALTDDIAPIVFINTTDSYARRLFTLVHELVHLWINQPGVSNLQDIGQHAAKGDAAIEVFCNRTAALTLLGERRFTTQWESRDPSISLEAQIESVADYFKVSEEVVARRLLDRQIIRQVDYESLRAHYHKRWREHSEAERKKQRETEGGPSYYLQKLHSNGRRLTQVVLSASASERITLRDASLLLGVKVNHLAKLAQQAGIEAAPTPGGG